MNNTSQENRQPLFIKLSDLVSKYLPKVHVDKTFQRRVCWTLEQRQSFILSLLSQHEAGTFSFADIMSGIERSNDDANNASLKRYEEALNLSKKYISLDAQNRGVAVSSYYDNQFGITGSFIVGGKEYNLEDTFYQDLPVEVKAKLDSTSMIVIIFECFLYSSLNDIFLSINDGLPMVDQEKRNSIPSWISTELLDKAEGAYENVLERVVKPETITRMGDVELLSKVLVATHKEHEWSETNKKTLDDFYLLGASKTREQVAEYAKIHMDRFYEIMNNVNSWLKAPKHKNLQKKAGALPNQTFWAAVLISEYLVDNDMKLIPEHGLDVDTLIYELDKYLATRAEQSRHAATTLFNNGSGPEVFNKDYYDRWAPLPHQHRALTQRRKEITTEFQKKYSDYLTSKVVPIIKVASSG